MFLPFLKKFFLCLDFLNVVRLCLSTTCPNFCLVFQQCYSNLIQFIFNVIGYGFEGHRKAESCFAACFGKYSECSEDYTYHYDMEDPHPSVPTLLPLKLQAKCVKKTNCPILYVPFFKQDMESLQRVHTRMSVKKPHKRSKFTIKQHLKEASFCCQLVPTADVSVQNYSSW